MRIRPRFWPTVTTALMLAALFGLGTWQLQRYVWKTELIDKLKSRSESTAVDLPAGPVDQDALEFQRVRVAGTYLYDNEFFLFGRSLRGSPGLHVITPLKRADGGGYVLIDRGWIPFERRAPATRLAGQVAGEAAFEGIVRIAKGPGMFTPDNEPKNNHWYYVDPPGMARAAGLDNFPDYYVLSAAETPPGGYPMTRQWRLDVRNNHIEYAVTWYLMAAILIVIYLLYHREQA